MRKELRHEIESHLFKYCAEKEENTAWVLLIGLYLTRIDGQMLKLCEMRYKERKSEKEICRALHIERSTYYSWISEIIQEVMMLAAYERLIRP